jgi:hypothetical protein
LALVKRHLVSATCFWRGNALNGFWQQNGDNDSFSTQWSEAEAEAERDVASGRSGAAWLGAARAAVTAASPFHIEKYYFVGAKPVKKLGI